MNWATLPNASDINLFLFCLRSVQQHTFRHMATVYLAIRLSEISKMGNKQDFSWQVGKCMHIMQSAAASDYTKMIYYNIQHQHHAQQLSERT